ncbi:four helix bundle protein [bacterium]|nr:four helix bundle protein [bacterium]
MIRTFKDLIVWQKAHKLVLKVYEITRTFPKEEKFGLTSDFRRAARSIATNIVEGYKRTGYRDALHFFNISDSSLAEVRYHTIIAYDLNYINKEEYVLLEEMEDEIGRILNGWQKNYQARNRI